MGYARPFDLYDSRPLDRADDARSSNDKLLGLELLRFASALAVLFFHYSHFARITGMPSVARTEVPFYSQFWLFYDYGQFGVEVFWAISGYIFFWKYGTAIASGAVAARDFFWLRFSRLYPLHIVTLIGVIGLQAIHRQLAGANFVYPTNDVVMFVRQLFLATDWGVSPPFNFNGPIWSISAEVAVYALFFILLRRFEPSRNLCIAVITIGVAFLLAGINWASIGCATFFFAGGLASLAPAKSRRIAAIALITTIVLWAATDAFGDRAKVPTFLLITAPCALILLARISVPTRWQQPIQTAGNLTYSSYLLHFPQQLALAIFVAASGWIPPLTSSWFLGAYLGVTFAVASLSYRRFELPAQNWLRRHTLRRAA